MGLFLETFNLANGLAAIVSGFMLGYFAFLPIVNQVAPQPRREKEPSPGQLFVLAFVSLTVLLSIIAVTFYAGQVLSELLTGSPFWARAAGRAGIFLVYIVALALGVATKSYRARREVP